MRIKRLLLISLVLILSISVIFSSGCEVLNFLMSRSLGNPNYQDEKDTPEWQKELDKLIHAATAEYWDLALFSGPTAVSTSCLFFFCAAKEFSVLAIIRDAALLFCNARDSKLVSSSLLGSCSLPVLSLYNPGSESPVPLREKPAHRQDFFYSSCCRSPAVYISL